MACERQDRVGRPAGPMARIVLAQDLAARLPEAKVLMPGDPVPPNGAASVHVSMQEFMPDGAGSVALQADWFVTAPQAGGLLAQGRFSRALPCGKSPAAQAREMSGLLAHLADTIARGLLSRAGGSL
ncbi:PqiC family protein [Acidocella sp. MX-AZ03]|nr:ABC-type transport auxiliary lipoprotein family protein [Acidocella sp. MX-AZ03]WBO61163.1 PqiC family protein [Acidocella sp. MX-AZ03]